MVRVSIFHLQHKLESEFNLKPMLASWNMPNNFKIIIPF